MGSTNSMARKKDQPWARESKSPSLPLVGTGQRGGADLFEEAIRRYCKHSRMVYRGMMAERHLGYDTKFFNEEKEMHARDFAKTLMKRCEERLVK